MTIQLRLAAIFVICAINGPVLATTITTTTLPNGMQVRIRADEDLTLTEVTMVFAAGRANDPDSLGGLAHLAEHLLTESSHTYPDGGLMRQSTLYSTYHNAYTNSGYMGFVTQCLPGFLPRVLALEVERLGGSGLDDASFAREKAIVLEEMSYGMRRTPWAEHIEDLYQACYRGHPFGEPVIGTAASVGRMTLADFEAFRQRNILPHRAVLIVSGPLDPDETLDLVEQLFTMGPPAQPQSLQVPDYPPVHSVQIITDSADFEGVRVSLACRIPQANNFDTVLAFCLPDLLAPKRFGLGVGAVPGETLVNLGLFFGYYRPPSKASYGYRYPDFNPDQDAQRALGALWTRLDERMAELANPTLFDQRRQRALDNVGDFGSDHGAGAVLVSGNAVLDSESARETLTELTFPQLADFVDRFINTKRAAVGITHGSDSERQQAIKLASRVAHNDQAQAKDALATLTAPEIEPVLAAYGRAGLQPVTLRYLANGIPFAYLKLPGQTRVRLGGHRALPPLKWQKPGNKPGITRLWGRVVDYDDRQRPDPDNPNDYPRKLPYNLDFQLWAGRLRFSVSGPEDKVSRMVFHLNRRLESRDFNQERWYQVTRNGSGDLAEITAKPSMQARGWRMAQIFGEKYHDLGYWRLDPGTVDKVRYKDLVKLHKEVTNKTEQTMLYGTGSISPSAIVTELEATLGQRDRFVPYHADPPDVETLTGITGRVVPDLTSGDVRLNLIFALEPDAKRLKPAEHLLLEKLLTQILLSRLRENEGLTYSGLITGWTLYGLTLWEAAVTCQPGQAHLVLAALRDELRRVTTSGCTADEIARARLGLTGKLVRSFSDPDQGLALLRRLAAWGSYPEHLLKTVAEMGDAHINDMAGKVVSADRFVFTALGPMFEEDLEVFELE